MHASPAPAFQSDPCSLREPRDRRLKATLHGFAAFAPAGRSPHGHRPARRATSRRGRLQRCRDDTWRPISPAWRGRARRRHPGGPALEERDVGRRAQRIGVVLHPRVILERQLLRRGSISWQQARDALEPRIGVLEHEAGASTLWLDVVVRGRDEAARRVELRGRSVAESLPLVRAGAWHRKPSRSNRCVPASMRTAARRCCRRRRRRPGSPTVNSSTCAASRKARQSCDLRETQAGQVGGRARLQQGGAQERRRDGVRRPRRRSGRAAELHLDESSGAPLTAILSFGSCRRAPSGRCSSPRS